MSDINNRRHISAANNINDTSDMRDINNMPAAASDMTSISRLAAALRTAEAVIIGAGAGLSTAAGFTYSGERFQKYFSDFEAAYGFHDMYSGGFYPYKTPEEFWAYWSRNIYSNRYLPIPNDTYTILHQLMQDKEYFVLTTNVDHCFQKSGFDKKRLYYTQGDYGLFQCSVPCHQKTYDNEAVITAMYREQKNMRIPSSLIPTCPVCGKPMTTNLRIDSRFVQDQGWYKAAERYEAFLQHHAGRSILFLELGVGSNTPGIIKYPFWRFTRENPNAIYACINLGEAVAPKEIRSQSICIDGDIHDVLTELLSTV